MSSRSSARRAGASARARFRQERWRNLRDDWRAWAITIVLVIAVFVYSFYVEGVAARLLAAVGGGLAAMMGFGWLLGGHASALSWRWGAEGEQWTAREIEKLGVEWRVEHDIPHEYGNWDHVVVGPPGVYLLDTKALHGSPEVRDDALRSGRLVFRGAPARGGAREIHDLLAERFGRAPWVQAVVVVWGELSHDWVEEQRVIYVRGTKLADLLASQPPRLPPARVLEVAAVIRELSVAA
jgi:Nuclease-related domain